MRDAVPLGPASSYTAWGQDWSPLHGATTDAVALAAAVGFTLMISNDVAAALIAVAFAALLCTTFG